MHPIALFLQILEYQFLHLDDFFFGTHIPFVHDGGEKPFHLTLGFECDGRG